MVVGVGLSRSRQPDLRQECYFPVLIAGICRLNFTAKTTETKESFQVVASKQEGNVNANKSH